MVNPFIIPLNAVRAIEIVARRGSLSMAAEELGVTAGAVSQHLRRAEERLGVVLFERTPRGLVPTEALAQILPQLSAGFATLHDAMATLRGSEEGILTLTVGSVFASRWLIWRINKFSLAHPDIEVRLVVSGTVMDLNRLDIDCAVRFGAGDWPGVRATLIGGQKVSPVCAPAMARLLKDPANLAHVPVIRDEKTMLSWTDWFASAGLSPAPETHGPTYLDPSLAFDAAISEQGVLLAADMMSADAVSDGRLVRPFATAVESPFGYWFASAAGRRETRKIRLFREWLLEEAPASLLGYVHQLKR